MRLMGFSILLGLACSMGCATSFTGSAHVEGGRNGCEAKCRGQGMQLAGLVYMGEYSSACVCEVPRTTGARAPHHLVSEAGAASGAVAGVMMQMEEQRRAQQGYVMGTMGR